MDTDRLRRRNRLLGLGMAGVVAGMTGLAFASVPLYRLFCQVTGYGGTVQTGTAAAPGPSGTNITIRFNATVNAGLPWEFGPAQRSMTLPIGEEGMAFYHARSTSGEPSTGIATFNVQPGLTGGYFVKVQCFCFNEQTLQPGETMDFPVVFYLEPGIKADANTRDLTEMTLSYTYFASKNGQPQAALATPVGTKAN